MSAYNFFLKICVLSAAAHTQYSRRRCKKLLRCIKNRKKTPGVPELPGELEAQREASERLWGHRWS